MTVIRQVTVLTLTQDSDRHLFYWKIKAGGIRSWEVYDSTRDPINVGERFFVNKQLY